MRLPPFLGVVAALERVCSAIFALDRLSVGRNYVKTGKSQQPGDVRCVMGASQVRRMEPQLHVGLGTCRGLQLMFGAYHAGSRGAAVFNDTCK